MVQVQELINGIKEDLNGKKRNASQKDEIAVMQSMLQDTSYAVGIYDNSGKIDEYCPAEDFITMGTSLIQSTTKISKDEARSLMESHEVSKSEAKSMVNISKQFVNTYLETNRKLPLGGRKETNFILSLKEVPEREKRIPNKNSDEKLTTTIPAHVGLKAKCSCPSWVK